MHSVDVSSIDVIGPARFVIERDQRLSASLLWQCQRRFYAEHGLLAWTAHGVPHHDTTSPLLAEAHARVVLGHLRDRARAGARGHTYVVELGGGSGRFAHHFLECLRARLEAAGEEMSVTYVLTDLAPSLVEAWRSHPRLREHVERGVLDFAVYDATRPGPLSLVERGTTLDRSTLDAPLVVIANAVLGALPADCFRVANGELAAGLVTLSTPTEIADVTAPDVLADLDVTVTADPIAGTYYDDPTLDALLARYGAHLEDASFLVPIAALRCIAHLRALAPGLLALCVDRGLVDEQDLQGRDEPDLAIHGALSTALNFDALATYARATGGRVYHAVPARDRFEVVGLALDLPAAAHETACAFEDAFELDSPADALDVATAVGHAYDQCSLAELLAHLRASYADAEVFWRCYPALCERVQDASRRERAATARLLARVWEMHFSLGEPADLALAIASVLDAMDAHDDARWYAEQSIRERGATPLARFQLAKSLRALGDVAAAREELALLLTADPGFAPARELRARLDADADGRSA